MKVRIHRGAHEIGGNCIEVDAGGARIVLDVGRPLAALPTDVVPLPDIPGLDDGNDKSLLGLFISHGHQDHWGLISQVSPKVPVYMGEASSSILREAAFFTRAGYDIKTAGFLQHRTPLTLGPFLITPYLNDHAGFDTYSLLIEAGGRRLFYTADFEGHGRKAAIFEELLRKPPKDVDVMLMEGTNIKEDDAPGDELSERDVENAMVAEFRSAPAMTLILYSAQNMDRLVTIYRAAKRAGKTL
ncbi:MAG: MBL fold metallo-hydrolase, partial [Actinomycetota bacterium]